MCSSMSIQPRSCIVEPVERERAQRAAHQHGGRHFHAPLLPLRGTHHRHLLEIGPVPEVEERIRPRRRQIPSVERLVRASSTSVCAVGTSMLKIAPRLVWVNSKPKNEQHSTSRWARSRAVASAPTASTRSSRVADTRVASRTDVANSRSNSAVRSGCSGVGVSMTRAPIPLRCCRPYFDDKPTPIRVMRPCRETWSCSSCPSCLWCPS